MPEDTLTISPLDTLELTAPVPAYLKGECEEEEHDTISIATTPNPYASFFNNEGETHSMSSIPGVAGDPRPFRQSNDDGITALILFFIIGTILTISHLRHSFVAQFKEFMAPFREHELRQTVTTGERILQIALALMGAIGIALIFFNYTQQNISETFILDSEYQVIGIFCVELLLFYLFKLGIYAWVNSTFFYDCDLPKWNDTQALLQAILGVFILPAVLINVYNGLSTINTLYYLGFVFVLYEMLLFFKAFSIFFAKKVVKLQIFLYLCTLELLPLATLWAVLMQTANYLTINY